MHIGVHHRLLVFTWELIAGGVGGGGIHLSAQIVSVKVIGCEP